MKCPKCRTIDLRMPSGGATPVLRCYQCHGMWMAFEEAERLAPAGTILDPGSLLPARRDGAPDTGLCPNGHGLLTRAKVDLDEPFYLERCARCQGIWFDAGDWQRLAESHLVHHLRDLWDPSWQKTMRATRSERVHKERLAEALGPDLLARIDALADALRSHPSGPLGTAYLLERLTSTPGST